jgi:hypothetical protein
MKADFRASNGIGSFVRAAAAGVLSIDGEFPKKS